MHRSVINSCMELTQLSKEKQNIQAVINKSKPIAKTEESYKTTDYISLRLKNILQVKHRPSLYKVLERLNLKLNTSINFDGIKKHNLFIPKSNVLSQYSDYKNDIDNRKYSPLNHKAYSVKSSEKEFKYKTFLSRSIQQKHQTRFSNL